MLAAQPWSSEASHIEDRQQARPAQSNPCSCRMLQMAPESRWPVRSKEVDRRRILENAPELAIQFQNIDRVSAPLSGPSVYR